ncbi:MAG: GNAT family N-acetyltransferase [Clostridiales bacterium]|jgi:ribosomal protein S18 acetylase RimI-like enzyme|nr:GNAT family N-acetyltransferase [Clostridiales bacterium]
MGKITKCGSNDVDKLTPLLAKFRVELQAFNGICAPEDYESAKGELLEFFKADFPIYAYEEDGRYLGYIVCKADGAVWVEQLYVSSERQGSGIAGELFGIAESLAAPDTLFNWVHPNNDAMIGFLAKMGYNVLNLIEIRKKCEGDISRGKIVVGSNEFDY